MKMIVGLLAVLISFSSTVKADDIDWKFDVTKRLTELETRVTTLEKKVTPAKTTATTAALPVTTAPCYVDANGNMICPSAMQTVMATVAGDSTCPCNCGSVNCSCGGNTAMRMAAIQATTSNAFMGNGTRSGPIRGLFRRLFGGGGGCGG